MNLRTSRNIHEFAGTDRFLVERRLGAGGMGVVYRAYDRERRSYVALKTLKWAEPSWLYRFKREFRAAQDLEHPNLVSLGELFEEDGRWFFTMELVEGIDFLSYVRGLDEAPPLDSSVSPSEDTLRAARAIAQMADGGDRGFDERRLRSSFRQLAQGLAAIHAAGKVHRDIKPSNILVEPSGRVVLLDFGLVFDREEPGLSEDQGTVGTAEYMAPEQAAAKRVGPEADWYSAGVVLYQALAGVLPFSGRALEVLMRKQQHAPPPPSAHAGGVPRDLDALCRDLLLFEPGERPNQRQVFERLGIANRTPVPLVGTPQPTRATPFVGREAELEHLEGELEHVLAGGTSSVMVGGGSGLGKTALIHKFAEQAAERIPGMVVLSGRCYEREAVSFKAFDGIVDALSRHMRSLSDAEASALLPRDASLLPRLFPALGRVEAIARAPRTYRDSQQYDLRVRAFEALREMLSRLADRSRLVLVIDDLQWADADSLILLADILRPPDPPSLLLLTSSRPAAEWVAPTRFQELVPGRKLILRMRPLSLAESTVLANRLADEVGIGGEIDPRAIADEARGHPLHIYELVRHAVIAGPRREGRLRLEEAIYARVARLPAAAQRVLELVTLASAPMAEAIVHRAAKLPRSELNRAVSLLRVAQLVHIDRTTGDDALEPAHDRVREAVAASIDPEQQGALHERLAIALELEGGRPELLVRHLEAAGRREDAARNARTGAAQAFETLAFDRAAHLYAAALRLGSYAGEERRQLLLSLGEALVNASRGLEAASVFMEAGDGGDPATRLQCRRQAAEQLVTSGHVDEGLEALKVLLSEIGVSMPSTPRRALASLLWHRFKLRLRGIRWKRRRPTEIAREELLRLDAYKAASHGLAMIDPVRGADFNTRFLWHALGTGEPTRLARALGLQIATVAAEGGRKLERARKLVAHARALSEDVDDLYVRGWALSAEGAVHYFAGDFETAFQSMDRAITSFLNQTKGASWEIVNTGIFRLFTLRQMGRLKDLRMHYEQAVREATARGDRYVATSVRRYASLCWLGRDDVRGARDNLMAATWMPPVGRFHLQHWFELEAQSELALYEGSAGAFLEANQHRFREMERSLLLRLQVVRCLVRFLRGRLLVAAAVGDRAHERLAAAGKLARGLAQERPVPYGRDWASVLRACMAARRGDHDAARSELELAIERTDATKLNLLAAALRRRLGELVGGDEGAELVAAGEAWMAEQEIASPPRITALLVPGFDDDG